MSKNRISLCNIPRQIPLTWIDFVDRNNASVTEFDQYFASLSEFEQDELFGRMEGLKERASFGKLAGKVTEFQDIRLYPELFELKWRHFSKNRGTALIRQYHGEPILFPQVLVALHIHLKNVKVPEDQIKILQEQEISYAKLRYEAGRKQNWVL